MLAVLLLIKPEFSAVQLSKLFCFAVLFLFLTEFIYQVFGNGLCGVVTLCSLRFGAEPSLLPFFCMALFLALF